MPFEDSKRKSAEDMIVWVIDRDSEGKRLTPQARKKAINIGVKAWNDGTYETNGEAARFAIRQVASGIL